MITGMNVRSSEGTVKMGVILALLSGAVAAGAVTIYDHCHPIGAKKKY